MFFLMNSYVSWQNHHVSPFFISQNHIPTTIPWYPCDSPINPHFPNIFHHFTTKTPLPKRHRLAPGLLAAVAGSHSSPFAVHANEQRILLAGVACGPENGWNDHISKYIYIYIYISIYVCIEKEREKKKWKLIIIIVIVIVVIVVIVVTITTTIIVTIVVVVIIIILISGARLRGLSNDQFFMVCLGFHFVF